MPTLRDRYNAYVRACKAADIPRAEILTWGRWCKEYADCVRADMRGVVTRPTPERYLNAGDEQERRLNPLPVHGTSAKLAVKRAPWFWRGKGNQ